MHTARTFSPVHLFRLKIFVLLLPEDKSRMMTVIYSCFLSIRVPEDVVACEKINAGWRKSMSCALGFSPPEKDISYSTGHRLEKRWSAARLNSSSLYSSTDRLRGFFLERIRNMLVVAIGDRNPFEHSWMYLWRKLLHKLNHLRLDFGPGAPCFRITTHGAFKQGAGRIEL